MCWGSIGSVGRIAAGVGLVALAHVTHAWAQDQSGGKDSPPSKPVQRSPLSAAPPQRYETQSVGAPEAAAPLPPLPNDPGSKQLTARVEERWTALIHRDFAKVYQYETPKYRAHVTRDQFRNTFGSAAQWHVAKVTGIHYDRPDFATVEVMLDYSFDAPWRNTPVRAKAVEKEGWERIDGQWWHKPTRSKFAMPAGGTSGQQRP